MSMKAWDDHGPAKHRDRRIPGRRQSYCALLNHTRYGSAASHVLVAQATVNISSQTGAAKSDRQEDECAVKLEDSRVIMMREKSNHVTSSTHLRELIRGRIKGRTSTGQL